MAYAYNPTGQYIGQAGSDLMRQLFQLRMNAAAMRQKQAMAQQENMARIFASIAPLAENNPELLEVLQYFLPSTEEGASIITPEAIAALKERSEGARSHKEIIELLDRARDTKNDPAGSAIAYYILGTKYGYDVQKIFKLLSGGKEFTLGMQQPGSKEDRAIGYEQWVKEYVKSMMDDNPNMSFQDLHNHVQNASKTYFPDVAGPAADQTIEQSIRDLAEARKAGAEAEDLSTTGGVGGKKVLGDWDAIVRSVNETAGEMTFRAKARQAIAEYASIYTRATSDPAKYGAALPAFYGDNSRWSPEVWQVILGVRQSVETDPDQASLVFQAAIDEHAKAHDAAAAKYNGDLAKAKAYYSQWGTVLNELGIPDPWASEKAAPAQPAQPTPKVPPGAAVNPADVKAEKARRDAIRARVKAEKEARSKTKPSVPTQTKPKLFNLNTPVPEIPKGPQANTKPDIPLHGFGSMYAGRAPLRTKTGVVPIKREPRPITFGGVKKLVAKAGLIPAKTAQYTGPAFFDPATRKWYGTPTPEQKKAAEAMYKLPPVSNIPISPR